MLGRLSASAASYPDLLRFFIGLDLPFVFNGCISLLASLGFAGLWLRLRFQGAPGALGLALAL